MNTVPERLREFQQVHDDGFYPAESPPPDKQACDRRHRAIAEVLCRLPEEAYQRLKRLKESKRRSFSWFIPHLGVQGLVYPFLPNVRPLKHSTCLERFGMSITKPYARVIYLSPLLELRSHEHLVYVVAHELAHVFLNHAMHSCDDESEKAERETYRRVCLWGFHVEAQKAEGRCEELASEVTDPASVNLPEDVVHLLRLVRAAGIEMGDCYPDDDQMCVEFHSAGDIELFCNIARCSYRVEVEQYDQGDEAAPSFQVLLVAFIPTGEVAGLVKKFGEYVSALAKSPEAAK